MVPPGLLSVCPFFWDSLRWTVTVSFSVWENNVKSNCPNVALPKSMKYPSCWRVIDFAHSFLLIKGYRGKMLPKFSAVRNAFVAEVGLMESF